MSFKALAEQVEESGLFTNLPGTNRIPGDPKKLTELLL